MWRRTGLFSLSLAALLLAGDHPGIPPRAIADYAATGKAAGVTIAASVVPPEQVRKIFSKDLNHAGYIVMEVAVYPDAGSPVDFSSDEFTLRVGSDAAILAAQTPRTVASGEKPVTVASKSKTPQLPGNVHVYNTETIGYESGGYGRKGGVYTASGVGVGVGSSGGGAGPYGCDPDPRYPGRSGNCGPPPSQQPPKPPKDHAELQQQLEEKALPEGRTSEPVAGYLYFPKPSIKEKSPHYQLTWLRVAGQVSISVPSPK